MKKENIIKKNYEIDKILKNGKRYSNNLYNIYIMNNNQKKTRFCICVSKKLGNAVIRNKNKRQIKDIIDKSDLIFSNSKDYVIILKKQISTVKYVVKKEKLLNLLEGALNE